MKKQTLNLMSLDDAITFLKKNDEHYTVNNLDRDTVIKWASFLKEHEEKKIKKLESRKKVSKILK